MTPGQSPFKKKCAESGTSRVVWKSTLFI